MTPAIFDPVEFVPPNVACFGKRYTKRWQASVKQYRTYDYWRQLFWTAAISRFEWSGLPEGMDARYLETLLCGWGSFAATKRSTSGIMTYWAGRMTPVGNLDLYRNPNMIDIYSPNGNRQRRHCNYWFDRSGSNQYEKKCEIMHPDAVICWDNLARFPVLQLLDRQAQRLADMDTTADQHVRAMRVPYVITVDEYSKKQAQDMYNRIDSGQPAVFMNMSGMRAVNIQVLQTMNKAAYAGSDILNDELKIASAVYTMLGIDNNAAAEKKERVQTAETLANNEQFMIQRNSFLKPRKEFCEKINKMYGWNCDVKWSVPHMPQTDDSLPIVKGSQFLDSSGQVYPEEGATNANV